MNIFHELIMLDEITLKSIPSITIMLELGLTFEMDWAEVKQGLKERYGSARSSIPFQVMKVMEIRRKEGESLTEYFQQFGEGPRQLKYKVIDTCADTE